MGAVEKLLAVKSQVEGAKDQLRTAQASLSVATKTHKDLLDKAKSDYGVSSVEELEGVLGKLQTETDAELDSINTLLTSIQS
jgi:hypothetical protein